MTYGFPEQESERSESSRLSTNRVRLTIDRVVEDEEIPKGFWEKSMIALNRLNMFAGVTLMGVAGVTGVYSLLEGRYSHDTDVLFGIGLGLLYASTIGYVAGQINNENDSS